MHDRPASNLPLAIWPLVFENANEAILVTDRAGVILEVNPAFTRITGYSRDEAVGQRTSLLRSGYQDASFYRALWSALTGDGRWQGEIWNRRRDGNVYPEFLTISGVRDGDGRVTHYVAIFYDLGAVREQAERFKHLAHHDVLTGLPNRLALSLVLPQAVARARRHGTLLLVGLLDLDDFKPVNDTYGHRAGDELLRLFGGRIKEAMRASDTVARLGGDEFVLVLEGLAREDEAAAALERVRGTVERPFVLSGGIEVRIGLSLGWTLYPDDDPKGADDAEALLRNADMALYAAKADKLHRASWEQRWGQTAQSRILAAAPPPLDGYGDESARLLAMAAQPLEPAAAYFVDTFYAALNARESTRRILATLSAAELEALKQNQTRHMRALLDPGLDAELHRRRASHVGRVHALIGLSASDLVEAMGIYLHELSERVVALPGRVADRAALVHVVNLRLKEELKSQLDAMDAVGAAYRGWTADCIRIVAAAATPADAVVDCLDAIMALPGMVAAAWGERAADGHAVVRHAVGGFQAYCAAVDAAGMARGLDLDARERSSSTAAQAWARREVVANPSYVDARHAEAWRDAAAAAGIRSSAALPVLEHGEPVGLVTVYGAYPAQFETGLLRHALEILAALLAQAWSCKR